MSAAPDTPSQDTGACADFTDRDAARHAIRELEDQGIPRSRILVGGQAPDQDSAPMATGAQDKQTVNSMWRLGVRGTVLGFIGGGLAGGLLGAAVWSPMTPVWFFLAVAFAVFGTGLGLLWSFMIGKGEGDHMGTVYDDPAADQPTMVTVRTDDPGRLESLLDTLAAAGGDNPRRVPQESDRSER